MLKNPIPLVSQQIDHWSAANLTFCVCRLCFDSGAVWRMIKAGCSGWSGGVKHRGVMRMTCRNRAERERERGGRDAADCFLMTCQLRKDRLFVCVVGWVSLSRQCYLSLFSCSRKITPLWEEQTWHTLTEAGVLLIHVYFLFIHFLWNALPSLLISSFLV